MKLIRYVSSLTTLIFIAGVGGGGLTAGCHKPQTAIPQETEAKHVLTLTRNNFQSEVLASSQPVLVDFWAAWCGPCRMVAPTVAQLATEFEGRAKVGKVDVDAQPELAKQYGISAIPALMIFKDGKVVEQFIGVRSKSELQAALDRILATTAPAATPNS